MEQKPLGSNVFVLPVDDSYEDNLNDEERAKPATIIEDENEEVNDEENEAEESLYTPERPAHKKSFSRFKPLESTIP